MSKTIGAAIIGGTGYGAGELLRLLAVHSAVEVVSVVSTSSAGEEVTKHHSFLSGFYNGLKFSSELDLKALGKFESAVVFSALPHGKSAEAISKLLRNSGGQKLKVIDLSGDFRLKDSQARTRHYPESNDSQDIAEKFVYGLTELNREKIVKAECIANPGCLSGSCALAVLPITDAKFRGRISFDAKTGSSGGGRALAETMHHPFRHSNVNAYKALEHRHEPEIREAIGDAGGSRIEIAFVPHLLPISRGILTTAYLTLESPTTTEKLREQYRNFYKKSPFVRVRDAAPDLHGVVGSNFCDVSVVARGNQVVAFAAIDNLVKGMAGQAIQNMNLMTGLEETAGLWTPSIPLM